MKLKDLGEFKLLQSLPALVKKTTTKNVIVNIGDDAAVVKATAGYLVLTCDCLVEHVHFKLDTITPEDLGYKSLAVNVSDIAAMAAKPQYALISLALPADLEVSFFDRFYQGLNEAACKYGVDLIGGDLSSAKELVINVTAVGFCEHEKQIKTRLQACVGDYVLVTGQLGAAAAGLQLLLNPEMSPKVAQADSLIKAHVRPEARVKEALFLAAHGCQAMEDISDGLARDLTNICLASGVGCLVEAEKLPLAPGVTEVAKFTGMPATAFALNGGEDYELVFTVQPDYLATLLAEAEKAHIKITVVGRIKEADFGCQLLTKEGSIHPLKGGYNHFSR